MFTPAITATGVYVPPHTITNDELVGERDTVKDMLG